MTEELEFNQESDAPQIVVYDEVRRPAPRKPRRRFLQFGLRGMLAVTLLAAVAAWWISRPEVIEETLGVNGYHLRREVLIDEEGDSVNHGHWTLRDSTGNLLVEGRYQSGKPIGSWTYYHPGGRRALEGECREGQLEGPWTRWHNGGGQVSRTSFSAAAADGEINLSHDDGRLALEGAYQAGLRHGPWQRQNERGQTLSQGRYQDNRREGSWEFATGDADQPEQQNYIAGRVYSDIEGVLAALREEFACDDAARRANAAWCLASLGQAGLPQLLEALDSPRPELNILALRGLAQAGPSATGAVPRLVEVLSAGDPRQAKLALTALGQIGPGAKDAIPALEKLMGSQDDLKVETVILTISPDRTDVTERILREQVVGLIQPIHGEALTPAMSETGDRSPWDRVPRLPGEALRAILEQSSDAQLRAAAVVAMASSLPEQRETVDRLVQMLQDDDPLVRSTAILSLELTSHAYGDESVLLALKDVLVKDPSQLVRDAASTSLQQLEGGGFGSCCW